MTVEPSPSAPHGRWFAAPSWQRRLAGPLLLAVLGALPVRVVAAAPTAAAPAPTADRPGPPYPGMLRLQVDATDLAHHIFRVQERVPVQPGPLTLLFPQFLPGTHGAYGELGRLAGLQVRAGAVTLPWHRDTVDPFAFSVDVPAGTPALELSFQFLSAVSKQDGRVVMTPALLNLQWNSMLLVPAGFDTRSITVQAGVRLPAGWQQASALVVDPPSAAVEPAAGAGDAAGHHVGFQPVSLETLVDSPLFAGAYLKRVPLDPPGTAQPVTLDIVSDSADQLEASDAQWQAHRQLVQQADRLFGARHFRHYDLLLALSDDLGGIGLEHHESSENGVKPSYFKDWDRRAGPRDLLPHEFTHSWNGKFRRPADLWTSDYRTPMQDSLLWVYEGQTQFWGRVLAARSGLVTLAQTHDRLAGLAAYYTALAGRTWRNLQDTTNEATIGARGSDKDWRDWQRGADYYDESALLIWLDADMRIRERSGGRLSLDDFARAFFGGADQPGPDGRVKVQTYTFDDVVAALNRVQADDWAGFLRQRLDTHGPVTLDGLARAGWRLAWADTPSEFAKNDDREDKSDDFAYSIGLNLKADGKVDSVGWDSPAYRAGFSKALQVLAVNGLAYKATRLSEAISANRDGSAPLELLVKDGEHFRTLKIDYRGGLRYPRLERIPGTPERLDAALLAPRAR